MLSSGYMDCAGSAAPQLLEDVAAAEDTRLQRITVQQLLCNFEGSGTNVSALVRVRCSQRGRASLWLDTGPI